MVYGRGGLSVICRRVRNFGRLGLKVWHDGSSVRNIFEDSFTEEVTGAVKDFFDGRFKFVAS